MSNGMLILRIVVGLLFIGHGTQKLFGWFGGHGREGTARFFGSLGFRPPETMAVIGGVAETAGGLLLLLGLFTPLGSALIVGMMVAAILSVHVPKGIWNENGGLELPLVYLIAATAIAFSPGRFSLDRLLGFEWNGRIAAVTALGVGIIVAVGLTLSREVETQRPARSERSEPETQELPGGRDRGRAA